MTRSRTPDPRRKLEPLPTHASLFPAFSDLLDPRQPFLIPGLLLLAARVLGWIAIPFASEDAYITFRYARNLAAGNGLVYNPGEHVFGFSSPVWALWSAAGIALTRDPVKWAKAWSVVADVTTLLVLGRLLARHASRAAAWCFAFFFAVWPYDSAVCASGMEMNLMLALIALGAALAERNSLATGPALGLLALTRPEGVASAALIALAAGWRDRSIALAVFAAGVTALWAYFGSPIPQSLVAKSILYGTPGPWAGRHWWDWISPIVIGVGPALNATVHLTILRLILFPAGVAGVQVLWRRRRTGLGLAAFALLLVWAGYALVGVAYFSWYLLLPLMGIVVAASVGLSSVVRGRLVLITAALFCLTLWSVAQELYRGRAIAEYSGFGEVANDLLKSATPGQSVMLEPIGIIGYEAPLRVIDEIGLVAPRVAERRRGGDGWYTDLVRTERPDWLVVRRGVLRTGTAFAGRGTPFRNAAERDSVLSRYEHVFTAQPDAGDLALLVLRRR